MKSDRPHDSSSSGDSSQEKLSQNASRQAKECQKRGVEYRARGEYERAKAKFVEGLNITESFQRLTALRARLFHELAFTEEQLSEFKSADSHYRQSLELTQNNHDELSQGVTLYQLAHLKCQQSQWDDALRLYKQTLEIQRNIDDIDGQAYTLHQLAHIARDNGDIETALDYFDRLRRLDEAAGDRASRVAALHQMGMLLDHQNDLEKAASVYQEALELDQLSQQSTPEDWSNHGNTLTQLASIKQKQGELSDTIHLYQQASQCFDQVPSSHPAATTATIMKSNTLYYWGSILAELEEFEEASSLYHQALAIDERPYGKAAILAALGRLYIEKINDVEQGLSYLTEALDLLDDTHGDDKEYVQELMAQYAH